MNTVSDQLDNAEEPPTNRDAIKIIDAAIQSLKGGAVGAHWKDDVIEAARELYRSDRSLFQEKRADLKGASKEAQITEWTRAVRGSEENSSETQIDELLALVQERAELFHDPDGVCYATFEQGNHNETWGLGSKGFGDWLGYLAYKELDFTPSETTIKGALCTMRGIALHDGEEHPVYLRSAPLPCGGYMIDLTDEHWRAVEVTTTGWRVVEQPSVRFIRSGTAAPFPLPDSSGNVDILWSHVNIPEQDRPLVQAFLLESWRPDTPYLMLELCGEQGSAKSSTHKRLRQCSDPNTVPLRAAPKNCEDIFVTAANNHQASFENMSGISPKMQDTLCILATGGGFAKRKLYSDADESVIAVKRPVIANGIQPIAIRPDLIDRTVHIESPRILSFKPESELDAAFERDYAKIFGGLLNLLQLTLKALPTAEVKNPPRMADFARLGEAMFLATETDGSFIELYRENRTGSLQRSLDSSPVALAVQEFIKNEKEWTGTAKELKALLEGNHKPEGEGWPKSPKGLSEILIRLAPALREVGIEVERKPRTNTQRLLHIYLIENSESEKQSSPASLRHQCDEINDDVTVVTHNSETSENQQKDMYPNVGADDRVVL